MEDSQLIQKYNKTQAKHNAMEYSYGGFLYLHLILLCVASRRVESTEGAATKLDN